MPLNWRSFAIIFILFIATLAHATARTPANAPANATIDLTDAGAVSTLLSRLRSTSPSLPSSPLELNAASCAKFHLRRRALVIGLDGTTGNQLHYRALVQRQAPWLAALMEEGQFAPCIDLAHPSVGGHLDPRCARAFSGHRTGDDFRWLTGPGWGSVLTGVDNRKHQVKDNTPESLAVFSLTSATHPSFMRRLILAGMKTAAGGVASFMTSSKGSLVVPGIIDAECGMSMNSVAGSRSGSGPNPNYLPLVPLDATSSCNLTARFAGRSRDPRRDENLTSFLESQIENPTMDLVMGVYDQIDSAGHESGFSSNSNYLGAISKTDRLIGRLIQAVEAGVHERHEEWLIIVTSDHGGHNVGFWGTHGARDKEDDAIPFIVRQFGATRSLRGLSYPVTHMDVHPTVLAWFGLSMTPGLDGHVQSIE